MYSTTGNNSKKEYNKGFFGNKNISGVGTLGKTMQLSFVSHVQSFAIKLNYCTGKKNVSVLKDQEKVDQDNIF